MRMSIDEFRRKFPNLAREILGDEGVGVKVSIESKPVDPWRGYVPKPADYIRRCKTLEEAFEVIDYLERRGEISGEAANEYRRLLREFGLEYFGPRKSDDYYYKAASEYWRKLYRRREST